jgi:hypothetical protein
MKRIFFTLTAFFLVVASPVATGAGTQLTWERSQMQQVEIDPLLADQVSEVTLIGRNQTLQFTPQNVNSSGRQVFQVLIPSSFDLGIYEVRAVMNDGSVKNLSAIRIVEYQSQSYSPLTDTKTVATLSITLFTLIAAWGLSGELARKNNDEFEDDKSTLDSTDGGDVGRTAQENRSQRKGLISSTYLDQQRSVLTITTNRFSPLISRLIADGGYLQYSLGSLVLLFPISGALLGALAFQDIQGLGFISTPSFAISMAIIGLAVFDASAGFMAAIVFGLCAVTSQRFGNVYDIRTFLGLAILWTSASFIANATRGLRTSRRDSDNWERLTDVVFGSLVSGWAVRSLIIALDGLAHLRLPLAAHASKIGVITGCLIASRYLIEGYVNNKNRNYLAYLSPKDVNRQGSYFRLLSWFTKAFLFLFFVVSFLGVSWQIWAALFIVMFPTVTKVIRDKFPSSPLLFQIIPVGVPAMVVMTLVGRNFSEYINGLDLNPDSASKTIFVLASLPGFALGILKLFGQSAKEGDVRWYMRERMKIYYRVGGVLFFFSYIGLTVGFLG